MKTLFIILITVVTSFSFAAVTKDNFRKTLSAKLPTELCSKMAGCYSAKTAACAAKMKDPVNKCIVSGDAYFGKEITAETGGALSFLIRTCALRTFASENVSKLVKKNQKCQDFSTAAMKY
jgi:hypothetical protein